MRLKDILTLPTAKRYKRPQNPAAILETHYGNFLSDGTTDADDNAGGGTTPGTLIDIDNLVFHVNDAPSHSAKPLAYWRGTLQDPSVFTYNPDVDYESTGHRIATATFSNSAVLDGQISFRANGKVDSQGELITNPIIAIRDMFTTVGNWQPSDFDPITTQEAVRQCSRLGFTIHWAFTENKIYAQWLADLLVHYLADLQLTNQSQLAILIDTGDLIAPEQIMAELNSGRDVAGDDPDDAIRDDLDLRNLGNELIVNAQYSWATGRYGVHLDPGIPDATSQALFDRHAKEFNLPGIRSAAHMTSWARIFFSRHAINPALVYIPLRTLEHAWLSHGHFLTLTWPWGPGGSGWTRRILKVLGTRTRFGVPRNEPQGVDLECFDTRLTLRDSTYIEMTATDATAWYVWVNEAEQLEWDTSPMGLVSLNPGAPYNWIRLTAPNATNYYFQLAPNDAHVTWSWGTVQPAGTGVTFTGTLINRFSRVFELFVLDYPEIGWQRVA